MLGDIYVKIVRNEENCIQINKCNLRDKGENEEEP